MNIQISPEFKKQTLIAIASIVLFVVFYLVLFLLALGLTLGCLYAGITVIVAKPMFFTLALGIGLASLGIMITVFLLKFLFKRNTTDLSAYLEITRSEEPRLYAFIDEIVAATGTDFPKKVYLSTEVNASVFYDSGFWSMFLPIRKNLHIGMGLVNTITHDELKAIVAHEFGHFSQKSMKVGSYVYNVNQIFYNLLYDNESYYSTMSKWASASGIFALFVTIAGKIIFGIQWILQKMYGIVNRSYLALSREMEFHADEVAANVTGYLPLKTSLLRLDLAQKGYTNVLNFYDSKVDVAQVSTNLFKEQHFVMHFLAEKQGIPVVNQFPEVQIKDIDSFSTSKLVIKNQWASHPELTDRIAALERLNIVKPNPNQGPATALFMNPEKTQQVLTDRLFAGVNYSHPPVKQPIEGFEEAFKAYYAKETFHPDFQGYYDNHSPIDFKVIDPEKPGADFSSLFNHETASWTKELMILQNDLALLEAIKDQSVAISSYDYEGVKYKAKEAQQTIGVIKESIDTLKEKIKQHDQKIYAYFFHEAQDQSKLHNFKVYCDAYLTFDISFEANFKLANEVFEQLAFTHRENSFETILRNFENFKPIEKQLKEVLSELLKRVQETKELSEEVQQKIQSYIHSTPTYFRGERYHEENLAVLYEMLHYFQYLNQRIYFLNKKQWLDYALEIVGR